MSDTSIVPSYEQSAIAGINALMSVVRTLRSNVFVEGTDFGIIPGTNAKPVLLLPGMEKLLRTLRLVPHYIELTKIEDFDKPLFVYRYQCDLIETDTGTIVGSAIGSANSHESKWRWREQKRKCPKCGAEAINRSKYPPKNNPKGEPGWYCYSKAGGCGAEFNADDTAITGQTTGRIENPDVADQMNTIDKIAQKRALSSAIKGAAAVSELFTVDLEDMPGYNVQMYDPDTIIVEAPKNAPQATPMHATTSAAINDQKSSESAPNGVSWEFDLMALKTAVANHPIGKRHSGVERDNTINKMFSERLLDNLDSVQTAAGLVCERLKSHEKSPESKQQPAPEMAASEIPF